MAYEKCLVEGSKVKPHQKHDPQYSCSDVSKMEILSGHHADGCAHVGYINAKVCGCNPQPDQELPENPAKPSQPIFENRPRPDHELPETPDPKSGKKPNPGVR